MVIATDSIVFTSPAPDTVVVCTVQTVGRPGISVVFYWIVTHYPIGPVVSGPFPIRNAPDMLDVNNYVKIAWQPDVRATSYDILATPDPRLPMAPGSHPIAVAQNLTATEFLDQGQALSPYTLTGLPHGAPVRCGLYLNNEDFDRPTLQVKTCQLGVQRIIFPDGSTQSSAGGGSGGAGPPGPPGPAGPQGPAGATGPAGPAGTTGAQGPQGVPGATGSQGPTGATGAAGPQGPTGATGAQGPGGPTGPPGASVRILGSVPSQASLPATGNAQGDGWITTDTGFLWMWNGSTWTNVGTIVGPPGPTGAQGATGPAGAAGATGAQGPQGTTGATGAQGPQGIPGTTGATGATGPQGPDGPQGPAGPQGATGPQGPAGAGVPAPPNMAVQFDNAGAFGGSAQFTWDNNAAQLTISGANFGTPGYYVAEPTNGRTGAFYANQVGLHVDAGANTGLYLFSPNLIEILSQSQMVLTAGIAGGGPAFQFVTNSSAYAFEIMPNNFVGMNLPNITPAYQLDIEGDVNIRNSVYRINGVPFAMSDGAGGIDLTNVTNINGSAPGGGGSQTPWLSDIDGANHNLNGVGNINSASATINVLNVGDGANPGPWLLTIYGPQNSDIVMEAWAAAGNGAEIMLFNDTTQNFWCGVNASTNSNEPNNSFIYSGHDLTFVAGGSSPASMRLNSNNTFAIGYLFTKPNTYMLDVNGDVNIAPGHVYRIGGVPLSTGAAQTPWTSNIDAASFTLSNAGGIGIGRAPTASSVLAVSASSPGGAASIVNTNPSGAGSLSLANDISNTLNIGVGGSTRGVPAETNNGYINVLSANMDLVLETTGGELMRLTHAPTRRVGILNSAPAYALDVTGDVNVTGVYRINGVPLATGGGQTPWTSNINGAGFQLQNAGFIGIGVAAPAWPIDVYVSGAPAVCRLVADGQGAATENAQYMGFCYSASVAPAGGVFAAYTARGTQATPAALASQDPIAVLNAYGYDGSTWFNSANIQIKASAAWNASAHSTIITFSTTATSGALTERMRIDQSGNVGIGTTSPSFGFSVYRNNNHCFLSATADAGGGNVGVYANLFTGAGASGTGPSFNAYVGRGSQGAANPLQAGDVLLNINTSGVVTSPNSATGGSQLLVVATSAWSAASAETDMRFNLNAAGQIGGNNEKMRLTGSGFLGIGLTPTHQLQLSSDDAGKAATNTWTVTSDIRTKRNVQPFEGDMNVIRRLNPICAEYNGLGGTPEGMRVVSFDAAELREIVPPCVTSVKAKLREKDARETDLLCVNTHEIFFHMIRGMQELDERLSRFENISTPKPANHRRSTHK